MMRSLQHYNELSYESFMETYGNVTANPTDISRFNNNNKNDKEAMPTIVVDGLNDNSIGLESPAFVNGNRRNSSIIFRGENKNDDVTSNAEESMTSQSETVSNLKTIGENKSFLEKNDEKSEATNSAVQLLKLAPLSPSLSTTDKKKTFSLNSASTEDGVASTDSGSSVTSQWNNTMSVPATHLTSIEHKGYLDIRKKKKKWERFWCILQDSCLYCYNNPRSSITRHVILLRGYDVIADVINLKRTRFTFRLKQPKFATYEFCADNHQDYLLWVGSLEKQTRSYIPRDYSRVDELDSESNNSASPIFFRKPSIRRKKSMKVLKSSSENNDCDCERRKLLETIREQHRKLQEEYYLLEKIRVCSQELNKEENSVDLEDFPRRESCHQIRDFYEAEQKKEEMKSTVLGTFLSKRRHSVVLKLEDYKRELSPLNGLKRTDDHGYFSSMERRLKQMETMVNEVDLQFQNEELAKHNKLGMLRKKRDVELLLLEQREAIEHLKKLNLESIARKSMKQRSKSIATSHITGQDHFDASLFSFNQHNHSSTPLYKNSLGFNSTPTKLYEKSRSNSEPSDKSCFRKSSFISSNSNLDFEHGLLNIPSISMSSDVTSNDSNDDDVTRSLELDFQGNEAKDEKVDSDVMAFIEEFEVFAKSKIDQDKCDQRSISSTNTSN